MSTLKEQMDKLVSLKHRLAVWEALHAHLDGAFLSKDGQPAQMAIRVLDCAVVVVPEETIEDVLQAVGDGPIAEIKAQIEEIENQQVVILGEAKASA